MLLLLLLLVVVLAVRLIKSAGEVMCRSLGYGQGACAGWTGLYLRRFGEQ